MKLVQTNVFNYQNGLFFKKLKINCSDCRTHFKSVIPLSFAIVLFVARVWGEPNGSGPYLKSLDLIGLVYPILHRRIRQAL